MDPKEIRGLFEAYSEVYSQERLDEISDRLVEAMSSYDRNRQRAAQRAAARNEARAKGQTGNVPGVGYVTSRKEKETYTDERGTERHKTGGRMPKNEEVDLYDLILSHLLDEGYADTYEAAERLMVNMSEDWRESILEDYIDEARITRSMGRRANEYNKNKEQEAHMKRLKAHQEKMNTDSDYRQSHMDASKIHSRVKQVESFNIFVNTMISEGVSLDSYTWEEIQNVFNDLFESQYARENPEKYERDAKRGQSREQQLKSRVTGRLAQMDPEKRKRMEAMMRAQGL